ncbi:MAG TPA: DUF4249 domain-containing protein [Flavobacterium sp.]
MIKYILYITGLLGALILSSCEEVVDVNLDTAPSKLVIDASINWIKGTSGNIQKIKLSTTTGFFNTQIPTVSGAIIQITNSTNTVFNFVETPNPGEYTCINFTPVIGETYVLTVINAGQTYTATEKMIGTPNIDTIEQRNDAGFSGKDIEIKFYFKDNINEFNNYMTAFKINTTVSPYYTVFDDEFFQGNQSYQSYGNEDLAVGNQMTLELYGISKSYLNYMSILLNVSQGQDGPWSTTPTDVRGNLINQTDAKNYALGYFRLSEVDQRNYTVQ